VFPTQWLSYAMAFTNINTQISAKFTPVFACGMFDCNTEATSSRRRERTEPDGSARSKAHLQSACLPIVVSQFETVHPKYRPSMCQIFRRSCRKMLFSYLSIFDGNESSHQLASNCNDNPNGCSLCTFCKSLQLHSKRMNFFESPPWINHSTTAPTLTAVEATNPRAKDGLLPGYRWPIRPFSAIQSVNMMTDKTGTVGANKRRCDWHWRVSVHEEHRQ
jgi:hypothetical protein